MILCIITSASLTHSLTHSPQPHHKKKKKEKMSRERKKKREKRTYLPKLLTSILTPNPLQYLCAARMLVYKFIELVYVAVDDDVQALFDARVLGDLFRGEGFGHVCGSRTTGSSSSNRGCGGGSGCDELVYDGRGRGYLVSAIAVAIAVADDLRFAISAREPLEKRE